jgi:hypothetical protein
MHGPSGGMGLRNPDCRRHYVWVSKTEKNQGVDYYMDAGFDIEHYQGKDGVQAVGGMSTRKEGDVIERHAAILMSCSIERWEEICQFGMDGESGQDLADKMQKQITSPSAAQETIRGLGQRYAHAQNRTSELAPEG